MPTYSTSTEQKRDGAFIGIELSPEFCRKKITVASGQGKLYGGTVLGMTYTATGATTDGNTGNGTLAVSSTIGNLVLEGVYKLICTTAPSTFTLRDPTGRSLGIVTAGTAFTSDHIGVTVTAGGTAFVAGDSFTITVAKTKAKILAPAATDGTQTPYGILFGFVDATSADASAVACVKLAYVNSGELTWPSGITTNQKNAAIAALELKEIFIRA